MKSPGIGDDDEDIILWQLGRLNHELVIKKSGNFSRA
jgi:hypothetical protein